MSKHKKFTVDNTKFKFKIHNTMTYKETDSLHSILEEIKRKLEECKQVHLLRFINELNNEEKFNLLHQLKTIDFNEENDAFQKSLQVIQEQENSSGKKIEPVPITEFGSALTCGAEKIQYYWNNGLQAIAHGKVAALVLSGGQGSRLGISKPKGMITIGLPSGKTIFQIHIERIKRLQDLAKKFTENPIIPLYVMTSDTTHDQINRFLVENDYFQLGEDNIVLFKQGMHPCFNFDGQMLMSSKSSVAMAPGGTGDVYQALEKNGIYEDMEKRGIRYVYIYPVDNIMAKVADPIFVGYCMDVDTDCAAKVLKKHKAKQNVGNICKVDGLFSVVEYSEMSDDLAKLTDDNGELLFHSGSICMHMFTVDFMKQMSLKKLRPHVAKKKVPFVDEEGVPSNPTKPNAIKIERFVFEAFKFARNFVTWEVGYDEFSPIKNPNSEKYECPLTARTDLLSMHKSYLSELGAIVDHAEVEISPLVSYAGEDLAHTIKDVTFTPFSSTHLQSEEEYDKNQVDDTFKSFSQIFNIRPTMILDG